MQHHELAQLYSWRENTGATRWLLQVHRLQLQAKHKEGRGPPMKMRTNLLWVCCTRWQCPTAALPPTWPPRVPAGAAKQCSQPTTPTHQQGSITMLMLGTSDTNTSPPHQLQNQWQLRCRQLTRCCTVTGLSGHYTRTTLTRRRLCCPTLWLHTVHSGCRHQT